MSEAEKRGPEKSPEVAEKATRRRFPLAYKQQILAEADQCTGPGELGALLRREGLYSSTLSSWRRQRKSGTLAGKQRGRKPKPNKNEARELAKLKRENASLAVCGRKLSLFQFKHDGTGQMPEPGGEFDGHADVNEDDIRQIRVARKRCRRNMKIQPSEGSPSRFSPSVVNCGSDKQLAERCCGEYAVALLEIDAEWQAKQG